MAGHGVINSPSVNSTPIQVDEETRRNIKTKKLKQNQSNIIKSLFS